MMTKQGTITGRDAFIRNIASRLGRPEPLANAPEHPHRGVPEHYSAITLDREEKIELFIRNWTALTGRVLVVREEEAQPAIRAFLLEAIAEHGVKAVTRWEHERLEALGLDGALQEAGVRVVPWRPLDEAADSAAAGAPQDAGEAAAGDAERAPAGAAREAAAAAAAEAGGPNWAQRSPLLRAAEQCLLGLVWPDYAVANTSTLALLARGGKGRSVSLVTDVLFAVFHADQLVTRMGEAFAQVRTLYPQPEDMPSSVNLVTGPSRSADIENDLTIGIHGPGKVYAVIIQ